jgi:MFS family permease
MDALKNPLYRRVWLSSIVSNFGLIILMVGAGWAMTRMNGSPVMIALVQSATLGPIVIFALLGGSLADIFDRRLVALSALALGLAGSALLTSIAVSGHLTPLLLIICCVLVGSANALFSPAWQTSVAELVPPAQLPQAILLNSISYNVARSAGPAVGGVAVATAGPLAAFGINLIGFLPILIAFLTWRRQTTTRDLPRERLRSAMANGIWFVLHSGTIFRVMVRTLIASLQGAILPALAPIIARDMLDGGADTFGMLLAAYGVGAVLGIVGLNVVRRHIAPEKAVRLLLLVHVSGCLIVAAGHSTGLSLVGFTLAGAAQTCTTALFNISVQLNTPSWVNARALSIFQALTAAGVAIGAFCWGLAVQHLGIQTAIFCTPLLGIVAFGAGLVLPLPLLPQMSPAMPSDHSPRIPPDAIDPDAGPIQVELRYYIAAEDLGAFKSLMRDIADIRLRNGARDWSLSQVLGQPDIWVQRFQCPTWRDYLHMRSRSTQAERHKHETADAFNRDGAPTVVELRLLSR